MGQRIEEPSDLCLHTSSSKQYPHGRNRYRQEYDVGHVKKLHKESQARSHMPSEKVGYPANDKR